MKLAAAIICTVAVLSQVEAQRPISLPVKAHSGFDELRTRRPKRGSHPAHQYSIKPPVQLSNYGSLADDLRDRNSIAYPTNPFETIRDDNLLPMPDDEEDMSFYFGNFMDQLRSSAVLSTKVPFSKNGPFESMYSGGLPTHRLPLTEELIRFVDYLSECRPNWPCTLDIREHFMLAAQYGRKEIIELFLKKSKWTALRMVPDARQIAQSSKWELENMRFKAMEQKRLDEMRTLQVALIDVDATLQLLTSIESRIRPKKEK